MKTKIMDLKTILTFVLIFVLWLFVWGFLLPLLGIDT
jgi:hypothetical protein